MNDTLSLNKLEKIIELEATLREEYQLKLDEKDASINALTENKANLDIIFSTFCHFFNCSGRRSVVPLRFFRLFKIINNSRF